MMRAEDIPAICHVEAMAFGPWWKSLQGDSIQFPPLKAPHVRFLIAREPEGAFVAQKGKQVVGLIFSRTWGSIGWFGTFAVHPQFQGQGIGKSLLDASLDYLQQRQGRKIGLETMPESSSNLGLYLQYGFRPRFLTLAMKKEIAGNSGRGCLLPRWSAADRTTRRQWLGELRSATDQLYQGLDYTKEIIATESHSLGDTLVLMENGKAVGLSILWLASNREGWQNETAKIQVLGLHPASTNRENLSQLLEASSALARSAGMEAITISVNTFYTWALEEIQKHGFRVDRARVRMVLKGTERKEFQAQHVNLTHWAG
jgi:ribosomal protein S18 acetylase RimI-like enzyme